MQGRLTTSTRAEAELWARIVRAWHGDTPGCHLELASRYTRKYPDNVAGWVALADVLARFALYEEASQALRRAHRLMPLQERSKIYIQWGHFYNKKCDLKQAERWYRRALRSRPTTETLIFLGAILAKQGRFLAAKRCHCAAIRLATDPPDEAYYNLGLILRAERKYHQALECFERAIKIHPKYLIAKHARKDVLKAVKLRNGNR